MDRGSSGLQLRVASRFLVHAGELQPGQAFVTDPSSRNARIRIHQLLCFLERDLLDVDGWRFGRTLQC
jgi:hypothetical protein